MDKRVEFFQIIETPPGQEVARTYFASLLNTWNLDVAVAGATRVAENNGTLLPLEIAALVGGLRIISDFILANERP